VAGDHAIRIRDARARLGDEETFLAECSCGWLGTVYEARMAQNAARRESIKRVDLKRGDRNRPPRRVSDRAVPRADAA
jgi:hypothetical protein